MWLSTVMSPPIKRAKSREISSPSPVPPKRLDDELSPWLKRLNKPASVVTSMPMPESLMTKRKSLAPPDGCSVQSSSTCTAPASANLMALVIRLKSTCFTRVASSRARSGTPGATVMCRASPLRNACGRIKASTPWTRPRTSTSAGNKLRRPDSSCDMSRMSLRICKRWSADSVAVFSKSCWRGFKPVSSSSDNMPIRP